MEDPSGKSSISSNSERYGTANERLEETSNGIIENSDRRTFWKLISGMSITYKLHQPEHVSFTETADETAAKAASRTESSTHSNNNLNSQTTYSHYNNNNNKTYTNNISNHVDMVGTQQNLNHLQMSAASSSVMRESKTSYTNDLELSKPISPSTQPEGCHRTFPVVPYINISYGSAEMYNERKSPEQIQDLPCYLRDHSKNKDVPSSTDGCVITRSIQGLFVFFSYQTKLFTNFFIYTITANSLPNNTTEAKINTSRGSPTKNSSLNVNKVESLALVSQHQQKPIFVSDNYTFHEQIIMSGQQKSALQDKPKALVVSPQQVMILYMHKLTPYERTEIQVYPQIYFIGANAKKRPGVYGPNNSDYDNEQGAYIHIPHDHVAYRYEMLKIIGKGSFGQVIKAYDHKTHEHVALKIVRNEKRFHRQAQEEIRILHHLRRHDKYNTMNIIHMYDYFTFRNHTCITFELLSINLYELIKKNGFKGFSLQLVRKFAHSLLQCLDALYKHEIIHCDMKPENVLLKQQGRSGIKVLTYIILSIKQVYNF